MESDDIERGLKSLIEKTEKGSSVHKRCKVAILKYFCSQTFDENPQCDEIKNLEELVGKNHYNLIASVLRMIHKSISKKIQIKVRRDKTHYLEVVEPLSSLSFIKNIRNFIEKFMEQYGHSKKIRDKQIKQIYYFYNIKDDDCPECKREFLAVISKINKELKIPLVIVSNFTHTYLDKELDYNHSCSLILTEKEKYTQHQYCIIKFKHRSKVEFEGEYYNRDILIKHDATSGVHIDFNDNLDKNKIQMIAKFREHHVGRIEKAISDANQKHTYMFNSSNIDKNIELDELAIMLKVFAEVDMNKDEEYLHLSKSEKRKKFKAHRDTILNFLNLHYARSHTPTSLLKSLTYLLYSIKHSNQNQSTSEAFHNIRKVFIAIDKEDTIWKIIRTVKKSEKDDLNLSEADDNTIKIILHNIHKHSNSQKSFSEIFYELPFSAHKETLENSLETIMFVEDNQKRLGRFYEISIKSVTKAHEVLREKLWL